MAVPILPEAPMIAMVCLVRITLVLMRQSYHTTMPESIAFAQEKVLTFVNEWP